MYIHPGAATGNDFDSFRFHLLNAALDLPFLELEVRNAVAKQATDTVRAFVKSHRMAGARQLLRASHSRRTRTNHRHPFAGLARIRLWGDIAFCPGVIDDALFDQL